MAPLFFCSGVTFPVTIGHQNNKKKKIPTRMAAALWIIITRTIWWDIQKGPCCSAELNLLTWRGLSLSQAAHRRWDLREREHPGQLGIQQATVPKANGKRQFMAPSFRFFGSQGERGDAPSRLGPFAYPERKKKRNRLSFFLSLSLRIVPPCRVTSKSREKCFGGLVELS
jgi:hypothetical protein